MPSTIVDLVLHSQSIEGWKPDSRADALLSHLDNPTQTTPSFVRELIDHFIEQDRAIEQRPRPWYTRRLGRQPYQHHDYPVLWNTAALRSAELLHELDAQVSTARMCQLLEHYSSVEPSAEGLSRVHNFIFGDIYTWAGDLRTVGLGRSGIHFAPLTELEEQLAVAGDALRMSTMEESSTADTIATFLAYYIWAHPFRDGNGRTAMTMLLALHPSLQLNRVSRRNWYATAVASLPITATTPPNPHPWKTVVESILPQPRAAAA